MSYEKDEVGHYLDSIARIPMLTAAEEIELGRIVRRMQSLIKTYPNIENNEAIATQAGLTRLELKRIMRTGKTAKNRMIEANLRLVVSIAKKYHKNGMFLSLLDLAQEGSIGLSRAVETFDPSRGYKFSTFAFYHIKRSVTSAVNNKESTIRVAEKVVSNLKKVRRVSADAMAKGETLSFSKAVAIAGANHELIEAALRTQTLSLDFVMYGGSNKWNRNKTLDMFVASEVPAESDTELNESVVSAIHFCVEQLGDDARPLCESIGLNEGQVVKSDREIADELYVAKSTVQKKRAKAIKQLALLLEKQGITSETRFYREKVPA